MKKTIPRTAVVVAIALVAGVDAAAERFGAVDVFVDNAGHGCRAAVEEASVGEVEELFVACHELVDVTTHWMWSSSVSS